MIEPAISVITRQVSFDLMLLEPNTVPTPEQIYEILDPAGRPRHDRFRLRGG